MLLLGGLAVLAAGVATAALGARVAVSVPPGLRAVETFEVVAGCGAPEATALEAPAALTPPRVGATKIKGELAEPAEVTLRCRARRDNSAVAAAAPARAAGWAAEPWPAAGANDAESAPVLWRPSIGEMEKPIVEFQDEHSPGGSVLPDIVGACTDGLLEPCICVRQAETGIAPHLRTS